MRTTPPTTAETMMMVLALESSQESPSLDTTFPLPHSLQVTARVLLSWVQESQLLMASEQVMHIF